MKFLEAPAHNESGRARPRRAVGAELGPGSLQRSGDGGRGLGPGEGSRGEVPGSQKCSFLHLLLLTSSPLTKPSFPASSSGQRSRVSFSLLCCPLMLPPQPHRLQLCIVWRHTRLRGLCMGQRRGLAHLWLWSVVGGNCVRVKWNHPQPTRTGHSLKVGDRDQSVHAASVGACTQGPAGKVCVMLT